MGHLHELGSDERSQTREGANYRTLLGHRAYTLATTLRGGMLRVRSAVLLAVRRRRSLTSHVYRIAKDYFLLLHMASISARIAAGMAPLTAPFFGRRYFLGPRLDPLM